MYFLHGVQAQLAYLEVPHMTPNKHEKDSILHEKCVKTTHKKKKMKNNLTCETCEIRGSKIKSIINV